MRRLMFGLLSICVLFMIAPTYAQDVIGTGETETVVNPGQTLAFDVPAGWVVIRENDDFFFDYFLIASSQDALDNGPVNPGDVFIALYAVDVFFASDIEPECGTYGLLNYDPVLGGNLPDREPFSFINGLSVGAFSEVEVGGGVAARAEATHSELPITGAAYTLQTSDLSTGWLVYLAPGDEVDVAGVVAEEILASMRVPDYNPAPRDSLTIRGITSREISGTFDEAAQGLDEAADAQVFGLSPDGELIAALYAGQGEGSALRGGESPAPLYMCSTAPGASLDEGAICTTVPTGVGDLAMGELTALAWAADSSSFVVTGSSIFPARDANSPLPRYDVASGEVSLLGARGDFVASLPVYERPRLDAAVVGGLAEGETVTTGDTAAWLDERDMNRPREWDFIEVTGVGLDGAEISGWVVERAIREDVVRGPVMRFGPGIGSAIAYTVPAFGPDGTLYAVEQRTVQPQGGTTQTVVAFAPGEDTPQPLLELDANWLVKHAVASPNGDQLALLVTVDSDDDAQISTQSGLYVLDLTTTEITQVASHADMLTGLADWMHDTEDGQAARAFDFGGLEYTPDGGEIVVLHYSAFTRINPAFGHIVQINVATGAVSPALDQTRFESDEAFSNPMDFSLGNSWAALRGPEGAFIAPDGSLAYITSGRCPYVNALPADAAGVDGKRIGTLLRDANYFLYAQSPRDVARMANGRVLLNIGVPYLLQFNVE